MGSQEGALSHPLIRGAKRRRAKALLDLSNEAWKTELRDPATGEWTTARVWGIHNPADAVTALGKFLDLSGQPHSKAKILIALSKMKKGGIAKVKVTPSLTVSPSDRTAADILAHPHEGDTVSTLGAYGTLWTFKDGVWYAKGAAYTHSPQQFRDIIAKQVVPMRSSDFQTQTGKPISVPQIIAESKNENPGDPTLDLEYTDLGPEALLPALYSLEKGKHKQIKVLWHGNGDPALVTYDDNKGHSAPYTVNQNNTTEYMTPEQIVGKVTEAWAAKKDEQKKHVNATAVPIGTEQDAKDKILAKIKSGEWTTARVWWAKGPFPNTEATDDALVSYDPDNTNKPFHVEVDGVEDNGTEDQVAKSLLKGYTVHTEQEDAEADEGSPYEDFNEDIEASDGKVSKFMDAERVQMESGTKGLGDATTQEDAIRLYTGLGYEAINRALRKGERNDNAQQIRKAMQQAGLAGGQMLYRGINSRTVRHVLMNGGGPGTIFADKGFSSTSADPAREFSAKIDMHITTSDGLRGLSVREVSVNPAEDEVVLDAGTIFVIQDVHHKGAKTILEVMAFNPEDIEGIKKAIEEQGGDPDQIGA